MHTEGPFAPEDAAAARERYAALGTAAQEVTREVAKAMDFDGEEYDRRVTGEVVATARDALFASLLAVRVGDREDFEAWRADHPDYEVREAGSENVDRVTWHAAPAAGVAVAVTFQDEERAAVATLRRQSFGSVYRDLLGSGRGDGASGPDDADA